jgi:hypothetical protein
VLDIGVPTDSLSTALEPLKKEVTWICPAPLGMGTLITMYFTFGSEEAVRLGTAPAPGGRVLSYTLLPNGEAFVVISRFVSWEEKPFLVPASHHQKCDYIFADDDPHKTGRPARFVAFSNPKDGDRMLAWEYGGYLLASGMNRSSEPIATFRRTRVDAQSGSDEAA